jgi:DNA-directed RNA polymerase sigma subunit (sigma70/sigma32)
MRRAVELLAQPRGNHMLCLYYGLDPQRPHTLREIGARYGVAYWRVEAIITRAVARLLEPAES